MFLFIARVYSASTFGLITTIFAFSNILHSFFEFGFAFYFQREAASQNDKLQKEISSAVIFKLITFAAYLAVTLIYFHGEIEKNFYLLLQNRLP